MTKNKSLKFNYKIASDIFQHFQAESNTNFIKEVYKLLEVGDIIWESKDPGNFELVFSVKGSNCISSISFLNDCAVVCYSGFHFYGSIYFNFAASNVVEKDHYKGDKFLTNFFDYENKGLDILLNDILKFINQVDSKEIAMEYIEISNEEYKNLFEEIANVNLVDILEKYIEILNLDDKSRGYYQKVFEFMEEFDPEAVCWEPIREKYIMHTRNSNFKKVRIFNLISNETIISKNWEDNYYHNPNYKKLIL